MLFERKGIEFMDASAVFSSVLFQFRFLLRFEGPSSDSTPEPAHNLQVLKECDVYLCLSGVRECFNEAMARNVLEEEA